MSTVELFLKNKFYNDIFYVKEKLQRRLQKSFESKMESTGRIKKVKFAEFVVR
jgi:low affinity Fe/Cu permease